MSTNDKKLRWWELSDDASKDRYRQDILLQKKFSCVEKEKKMCCSVLDSEKRTFKSEMQRVLPKTNKCNFLSVIAKKLEYERQQQTTEKVQAFCGHEFKRSNTDYSEAEDVVQSRECHMSNWERLSTPIKKNRCKTVRLRLEMELNNKPLTSLSRPKSFPSLLNLPKKDLNSSFNSPNRYH
ncbi:DgyrCDS978 [Dimorphilus gyrociliatus]|uniref:DgyrCDS978 n=1 Tax=Dimorphilus gyrociliatus TaxID=2664684 RepID=A0A7I8V5W3_9ANNE|nr:DgyrCDS978 [Dimorphilus gyrociliatus]